MRFFGGDEGAKRAYAKWLTALKSDDEVMVERWYRFGGSREYIAKVVRRTKARIVITGEYGGEQQVRAADGDGYGWDGHIREVTQRDRDRAERAALWARIGQWQSKDSSASLDTLRAVVAAIDAEKKPGTDTDGGEER